jgi:hypothetical protein
MSVCSAFTEIHLRFLAVARPWRWWQINLTTQVDNPRFTEAMKVVDPGE